MKHYLFVLAFCGLVGGSGTFAQAIPDPLILAAEPTAIVGLPAPKLGPSTVMGGQIEKIDLVRDQLTLKVPGGHAVKILFDERTQVFEDGKQISVLNLVHPEGHASIETALNGSAIFALRIHMLSDAPGGELRGQIVSFDSSRRELKLRITGSSDTVVFFADEGIPVVRVGQGAFAEQNPGSLDLVKDAVVDVTFKAGRTTGMGVASRVAVLAVPGAEFVFSGTLTYLDLREGRMSIDGSSAGQTMDVSFSPSLFGGRQALHYGDAVKVRARFDGNRYVASQISAN